MSNRYSTVVQATSSDVDSAITIPLREGKQIIIRHVRVVGGSAGSDIRFFGWGDKNQSVVNAAVAVSDDAVNITGTGAADVLNGQTVQANWWCLLQLDTPRTHSALNGWQLLGVASVTGLTASQVSIDDLTPQDGENAPAAAISVGKTAYLVSPAGVETQIIGAATRTLGGNRDSCVFAGNRNHPVSVHLEAGGATAHEISLTAEYV